MPRKCSKNARDYVKEVTRAIPEAVEVREPIPERPLTLGYRIRLGEDGQALTVVCATQTAAWLSCYTRFIKRSAFAQTTQPDSQN